MSEITQKILTKKETTTVKTYLDEHLNPQKRNIFNSIQKNYAIVPEISQFLNELNINDKDYYDAL